MTSGGYVGLSLAVLLAQHHQVTALDIVPEKVEMINNKKSPIRDEYIEKYASDMATIKFYLNLLNLDSTQILKLNKFREMAEMPLID